MERNIDGEQTQEERKFIISIWPCLMPFFFALWLLLSGVFQDSMELITIASIIAFIGLFGISIRKEINKSFNGMTSYIKQLEAELEAMKNTSPE